MAKYAANRLFTRGFLPVFKDVAVSKIDLERWVRLHHAKITKYQLLIYVIHLPDQIDVVL